jgi:hypothetical protein
MPCMSNNDNGLCSCDDMHMLRMFPAIAKKFYLIFNNMQAIYITTKLTIMRHSVYENINYLWIIS